MVQLWANFVLRNVWMMRRLGVLGGAREDVGEAFLLFTSPRGKPRWSDRMQEWFLGEITRLKKQAYEHWLNLFAGNNSKWLVLIITSSIRAFVLKRRTQQKIDRGNYRVQKKYCKFSVVSYTAAIIQCHMLLNRRSWMHSGNRLLPKKPKTEASWLLHILRGWRKKILVNIWSATRITLIRAENASTSRSSSRYFCRSSRINSSSVSNRMTSCEEKRFLSPM